MTRRNNLNPDYDPNSPYVKAFEAEYKFQRELLDLITYMSGMSAADQGRIIGQIEKGLGWRRRFVEALITW